MEQTYLVLLGGGEDVGQQAVQAMLTEILRAPTPEELRQHGHQGGPDALLLLRQRTSVLLHAAEGMMLLAKVTDNHSHTHTHSHTSGRVNLAGQQPPRREQLRP